MKKLRITLLALVSAATLTVSTAGVTFAATDCATNPGAAVCQIKGGTGAVGDASAPSLGSRIKDVVNIILYILGAIAVVMIVIGGIRYVLSNGESGAIKSAKDTILYSVIGLIVAILAYSIVNFVVSNL